MTLRYYRLHSTPHDEGEAKLLDYDTETLQLYTLLYTMKVRPSPLNYDNVSLQTASILHDYKKGLYCFTMTLKLYRLTSTLHDDR